MVGQPYGGFPEPFRSQVLKDLPVTTGDLLYCLLVLVNELSVQLHSRLCDRIGRAQESKSYIYNFCYIIYLCILILENDAGFI